MSSRSRPPRKSLCLGPASRSRRPRKRPRLGLASVVCHARTRQPGDTPSSPSVAVGPRSCWGMPAPTTQWKPFLSTIFYGYKAEVRMRRGRRRRRPETHLRRTKDFPLEVKIAICAWLENFGAAERTAPGRAAGRDGGREICIHVECDPHARNENGGARHSA